MYEPECCPLVVDPLTVISLIGFIAAATGFLNTQITMLLRKKRRRRSAAGIESLSASGAEPIGRTVLETLEELEGFGKGKEFAEVGERSAPAACCLLISSLDRQAC